jgi:rhodanese-related sulfurtransferase
MSIIEVPSIYAAVVLNQCSHSMLIDVRTPEEWHTSGVPKLEIQKLLLLSWRLAPDFELNPEFENEIKIRIPDKQLDLFFICRSGGRSYEAARFVNNIGYTTCYNVIDGFEGSSESDSLGWKKSNLPYQVLSQNA